MLTDLQIHQFISRHRFPDKFRGLIDAHYLPLAEWLTRKRVSGEVLVLGINGAQGSGKSTLANFLEYALESGAGWRTAVLSIDDFYRTRAEREQLASDIHPLLRTRGVPGTHDVTEIENCIDLLKSLAAGSQMPLLRFDKARDDRTDPDSWPRVSGPVDQVILEGWCVGSRPQSGEALPKPTNSLEETEDASGDWRRYVNEQLAGRYQDLFSQLDALVFLQVPNFEAVYRWRLDQEQKLAESTGHDGVGIMNNEQLARFIQHYERLTKENLAVLPEYADVVLELNDEHDCVRSYYADGSGC